MRGDAAKVILTRAGLALLGRIRKAFITKSQGGVDEAGDSWKPLSPKTIAYRRMKKKRTRTEKKRDTYPSQALTKRQQERWWELYYEGVKKLNKDKASAAKRAWAIIKSEGAITLLDKYGNAQVPILIDTGALLESLSPGTSSPDQVFRIDQGSVTIGTTRQGAMAHHRGVPRRNLPQRRLWPDPDNWPESWWDDILNQIEQGLVELIVNAARKP